MKTRLLTILLLLTFGLAHAGPGGYVPRQHKAVDDNQTESMRSSAVQPGIGASAERMDSQRDRQLFVEESDWTDLRNEAIYGSW